MLDKLLNNAVYSAEIEWISSSYLFFLNSVFCSWEQVQPFYIYRRRKFCKGSRQLIWCLCGTVGCANTGKMLLSWHLHDFFLFFSVSRGEQERSKAAEETSILSLKDRTRLHTLIDPTQTSQSGWHNRNTALFPYHLKSPYLKKLNYVRPK